MCFGQPWSIYNYENLGGNSRLWPAIGHTALIWRRCWPSRCRFFGWAWGSRCGDCALAGLPLWLVILFVVPAVRAALFFAPAAACCRPKDGGTERHHTVFGIRLHNSLAGTVPRRRVGQRGDGDWHYVIIWGGAVWFGTTVLKEYGWSLFVGLPFMMGFLFGPDLRLS